MSEWPANARSVLRPHDAGSVLLAPLGEPTRVRVDRAGAVGFDGEPWSVEWWVGPGDRWIFPSTVATVRQRRTAAGAAVESRIRLGDADVVATTWALPGGLAATEIVNETPSPIAVAVALRPWGIRGETADEPVSMAVDGATLRRGGNTAVRLVRPPVESAVDTDPLGPARTLAEGATLGRADGARAGGDSPTAVALVPLPARARIRFTTHLDLAAGDAAPVVPDLDAVERSWSKLDEVAARIVLPDSGLTERAELARRRVRAEADELVDSVRTLGPDAGRLLGALASAGYESEVEVALASLARWMPPRPARRHRVDDARVAAGVVAGLATAAPMLSEALVAELLAPAVDLADRVRRHLDPDAARQAERQLGVLARHARQLDVARDLLVRPRPERGDGDERLAAVSALAAEGGEAGAWGHDEWRPAASLWGRIHRLLVDPHPGPTEDGDLVVDLLPAFPQAWRGGSLEVHRLPTIGGRVSFAIRWHGARPALLWEREDIGLPVVLRCPGLDPAWSSTEARGETLLAGSAGGLAAAPQAGDAFQ